MLLGLFVAIAFLFFTLIGIPVAIPLGIAAYLLWAVGATVGYVAIALRIVDRGAAAEAGGAEAEVDDWLVPILVAAGLNGALALTGIGALVSVAVGAAGFGVVITELTD